MYALSQDGKAITDRIDFNSYGDTIYNSYHEPFGIYESMDRVIEVIKEIEFHINNNYPYVYRFPKE